MSWHKKFINWFLEILKWVKNNKKLLKKILAIGLIVFVSFFVLTSRIIGQSVRETCFKAQLKYEETCVIALMDTLNNPRETYTDRNNAIWALGQIGDSRALDLLHSYYKGEKPRNHENLEQEISQYELYRAIKLLEGGVNLTAFIWR